MYLLIEVAGYINTLPTIGLVMLTAVIGVALLRQQGTSTLTRGVGKLNRGEIPAGEMAEGILLGIAGALLITPGFITDTVGFVLLFPPFRVLIAKRLLKGALMGGGVANVDGVVFGDRGNPQHPGMQPGRSPDRADNSGSDNAPPVTLEGDYIRRDDD